MTDLANVDELTGLGNRRLVNRVLQEEINRARRNGGRLAVILLDVDHFKPYNDSYGHIAGDKVLQQLADVMQRAVTRACGSWSSKNISPTVSRRWRPISP